MIHSNFRRNPMLNKRDEPFQSLVRRKQKGSQHGERTSENNKDKFRSTENTTKRSPPIGGIEQNATPTTTLKLIRAHWVWREEVISFCSPQPEEFHGSIGTSEPRERISCCLSSELLQISAYPPSDS